MRAQLLLYGAVVSLACGPGGGRADEINHGNASPACRPAVTSLLNVKLRAQKANFWCWAASGQMIMEYLGQSVDQCVQANNRLHRGDCCNDPAPKQCDIGGWPEFDKYGYSAKRTDNAPLPWVEVQAQLAPKDPNNPCSFTPFAFSWQWENEPGYGHMMVAVGYNTANGTHWITINDPSPVNIGQQKVIPYEDYDSVSGDHSHWDDFYAIK